MDLLGKIQDRAAVVSVIGLGYAGLPLALAFAEAGFRVVGIDLDGARVAQLNRGASYVQDVSPERLGALLGAGRFRATTDYATLGDVDTVTICVPTPLGPGHIPDLSYIEQAVAGLAPYLRREQLVVLESTTYPGTTEELVQPRLEAGGLRAGADFYLGFAPERIDPGATSSQGYTMATVPKLAAGATPRCRERVAALYGTIVETVVPVSSLKTAEMAKLVENAFRMVNIGFANEVALMCDRLGTDVWEVIDAAATKPYGFLAHYPGPGLGGHCIPVDPYYLVWRLRTLDFPARFIELAGEVNRSMPSFVVSRVADALERRGQTLRGARVLVLGVTYKRDVADTRESPSLDVLSLLLERGAVADFHDPFVAHVDVPLGTRPAAPAPLTAGHNGTTVGHAAKAPAVAQRPSGVRRLASVELLPALDGADCVVVCTDHSAYDWDEVVARARLVVDTRNALRRMQPPLGAPPPGSDREPKWSSCSRRAPHGTKRMRSIPPPYQVAPRARRHPALRLLLLCFLTGVAVVPVCAGALLYFTLTGAFASISLEQLLAPLTAPAVAPPPAPPALVAPPPEPVEAPPAWPGGSRVNVLLLGNDRREGQSDIPRTDTIIVLTIDTEARTAGLLSLPRDLWVAIPGHGNDRINAAFEIGEARKRDGGPELARKTVEALLGVPIHHHVLIGFAGFQRLVDEVGGVTIDVERPIKDDEYPNADYSMRRIFFQPGLQRMDGETALWYVRTRHGDSDFGRARRQQQFLLAMRRQAMQLNLLPKAPALLRALADTFKTDFQAHEVVALARVAREVDTSKLSNRVIDESMTTHWITPSGAQVEIPDRAAVKQMVQDVFGTAAPAR